MEDRLTRLRILYGDEKTEHLKKCRVIVFGIGGVGGYATEAIARSGIGTIDIVDKDTVDITNLNRQIISLESTVGRAKTEVMKERIHDISPDIVVNTYNTFFLPENSGEFDFTLYDYVLDCVDTVTAKLEIIRKAKEAKVPVISCMGTGGKIHPELLEVSDIYKTSVCPLAKVMRHELKKRGIDSLEVVFSKEVPVTNDRPPGSCSFVPGTAGLIMASRVINHLTEAF